jgi:murein L,D-transpeptidase YafK
VIRPFLNLLQLLAPALAALVLSSAPSFADDAAINPDRILVLKSERKLHLMAGNNIVRSMDIALGLRPDGPKRREGDFKTPEGRYVIEARNPNSDFFLSLKVSYPNERDRALAAELGVDPGGMIMIHGMPNEPKHAEAMYEDWDWTDGCIAVSNSDMIDLWRLTAVAMPIEIRP